MYRLNFHRLYATASEHAVFYQYNFHSAANIYAGMIKTESPYFQPTPRPPAPFTSVVGKFTGDPDYTCAAGDEFSGCDQSWSTIMTGSKNIFIAAAGLYSVSSTDCISYHIISYHIISYIASCHALNALYWKDTTKSRHKTKLTAIAMISGSPHTANHASTRRSAKRR